MFIEQGLSIWQWAVAALLALAGLYVLLLTEGQKVKGWHGWFQQRPWWSLLIVACLWATAAWAADTKISAFTDGSYAQNGDQLPVARSAANNAVTADNLTTYEAIGYPRGHFLYYNDFINDTATTATSNDLSETNSTGSTSQITTDATNHVGVIESTTAASATGRSALMSGASIMTFSGGAAVFEALVKFPTLSNGTERYQAPIGFIDTATAANQVDGCFFLYDEGGVSSGTATGNWQAACSNNSTRTFCTPGAGVAVAAATYVTLRIEVNAAGTSVTFFINGSSYCTVASNIPTTTARAFGFGWLLIKSIGTTARSMDVDYIAVQQDFTTPRGS